MDTQPARILIVDDDAEIRYSLQRVLSPEGHEITEAGSGEEGIEKAREVDPAVVLMDNRMNGMTGVEALQHLRSVVPDAMVVMMTAFGTTQTAIEAMKFGAFDYIIKPFEPSRIIELVRKAAFAHQQRSAARPAEAPGLNSDDYREGIVGSPEAMQEVLKQIGQVTASDATVLITGESGTGKELVARCICQHSHRANKPFIPVNCAAIPDNLIESELFGHEKGSFTGAMAQRIGHFERCDGGTIFLDEIGDMALPTQTKILRVLQEGEIQRVGGAAPIQVDVRLVAATNRDIEDMVAKGDFREDLYYRLNVFRIRIPSLRERPGDIPEIVDFHLQRLAKSRKIRSRRVSGEVLEILAGYRWPGNVRELENVIYRSAVVAKGEMILPGDLPSEIVGGKGGLRHPGPSSPAGENPDALFKRWYDAVRVRGDENLLEVVDRETIRLALEECEGGQAKAASLLGIGRTALRSRIDQLGLRSEAE